MTRNDIRRPESSPQRGVMAQLLLRRRYLILSTIALVYLTTLAILANRQNLDVNNYQPNLYGQKRKNKGARIGRSECTFCDGERGIPNLDLVLPQAGGNTCRSIKSMAAREMKGSDTCAILQKEERVCCPPPYSPPKTIFVISLQGTPGAHESNNGRLDLFKEKWRMACGSSSDSTNIEHCPAAVDKRRGYGLTLTWMMCLWRARQLDEEVAIFLEDDARLFANSTQEFCDVDKRGKLLSKLPSDTFVAWLGGHTWSYEDPISTVPYRRVRNSYGTYGFLVPRNSIDDFHAALKDGLINGSKDRKQNVHHNSLDPEPNFYRAAREHKKKMYAFNPLVIWHEGGYSNTWGKVRGDITGIETGRHGIKVGSGITNTNKRKRSVDAGHQSAVQQIDSKHLPPQSASSIPETATPQCSFCDGERVIPNLDLVVPQTGGNTCRSIKSMAAREMKGSATCVILQKEERVCCPVVYENALSLVEPISSQNNDEQSKLLVPFKEGDHVVYDKRNELRLAEIVDVVNEKSKITLKYFKPHSSTASEETVEYREGLLHEHSEALRFQTGTFANCAFDYVENNTLHFTKPNDKSANVSCKRIRFAAEAGSFVGKSGVIVGVLSTSDNFRWRNVIRSTWAAESTVFFVIAGSWDDIEDEYHRYKDIIWIDMEDSFRLITYKTSMFFQVVNMMASELNLTYSHALKTDDDSYAAIGRLEQLVKEEKPTTIDYWGYSDMKYVKPLRNLKSRYYVSLDQYPEPYYPPYVAGAAILLSHKTVECVSDEMQNARFLDMEDAFIGIVAARCGVIPTHSELVKVYRGSVGLSRWTTTGNKTLHVTMKGKIIQHRILNLEDMIAHHKSIKTSLANTNERKKTVGLGNDWNGYRLADGVKGYDRKIRDKTDVCKRWPGSILCEYLKRTEQKQDFPTLADIVRNWNTAEWGETDKPSANTTVMHLRLGDGLCGRHDQARLHCRTGNPENRSCWDNDADCFKSTGGLLYAYPKEYYEPVAQDLSKFLGNKTTIIVVADPSHWGRNKDMRNGDYSIDYAYRDNVVSFFQSKGFITQVRQNSGNPDDDFVYMSSAHNFVRGGGAFSRYAAEVVTANGGRVFEPRVLIAAPKDESPKRHEGKRRTNQNTAKSANAWEVVPAAGHVDGTLAELKPATLCACAKCGTTSLWEELFEIVEGKSFKSMNYTGPPWVHDLSNKKLWTNIHAVRKSDWSNFQNQDSFALIRDPKERIVSAWKSKVRCNTRTEIPGHRMVVPLLLKLAGPSSNISARTDEGFPCLDLSDFLAVLSHVHAQGKEALLENHLLPQHLGCFKNTPPSMWTVVTTISNPRARCFLKSVVLKTPNSKSEEDCQMIQTHNYTLSLNLTRADKDILDRITSKEYEMLGSYLVA